MQIKQVIFSKVSTFVEKANILSDNGYKEIVFPMGDDTYDRITNDEKDKLVSLGGSILLFKRNKETFSDNHPVINKMSWDLPRQESHSSSEIRKKAI